MSLFEMFLARNLNSYRPSKKTLFDESLFYTILSCIEPIQGGERCRKFEDIYRAAILFLAAISHVIPAYDGPNLSVENYVDVSHNVRS